MKSFLPARAPRISIGGRPQVNLLPEDVRAGRRLRRARRVMVGAVAAAVVVAGAASGGAYLLERQSYAALSDAQQQANALLSQQARFAGVTSVRAGLMSAAAAQRAASVRMIDWETYLDALGTSLPKGLAIGSVAVDSSIPTAASGAPSSGAGSTATGSTTTGSAPNVFVAPHVATITVHVLTTRLSTVQTWIGSLRGLTGYVDASPGAVTSAASGGLDVVVTVHLSSKAYTTPAAMGAATATATDSVTASIAGTGTNGEQQ